jgi:hypothetical protein
MSSTLICPACKRKLRLPETSSGKKLRCPACNALLPAVLEAEIVSPELLVKTAPSPRTAEPIPSRPRREEERQDERRPAAAAPIREKSSRSDSPYRKNSSTGLIIGLAVGGAALMLLLMIAGGATLIWYFARTTSADSSKIEGATSALKGDPPLQLPAEAPGPEEWRPFTPPNGDCSVLMPGTPQSRPTTTLGITINKYLLTRTETKDFYLIAFVDFGPDAQPPNILETIANAQRDHLLRILHGKVTNETTLTLGNLPGREFQIGTQPQGTIIQRFFLARLGGNHRLYMVAAAGDSMTANADEATRFFASFKIEGAAQPPTYLSGAPPASQRKPPVILFEPPHLNPRPLPPRPIPGPRMPRGPRRLP